MIRNHLGLNGRNISRKLNFTSSFPKGRSPSSYASIDSIAQTLLGFRAGHILLTAVQLGVFEAFQARKLESSQLATFLNLDSDSCEILLDALVSLGFLKKQGRKYFPTLTTRQYLLKKSPQSFYHNMKYQYSLIPKWGELGKIVKNGRSNRNLVKKIADPDFTENYILGMKELARSSAPEVAEHLCPLLPARMLDVGSGPGTYSVELLKRLPGLKVDMLDLPVTIKIAKKLLEKYRDRINYMKTDYHKFDFGEQIYDLILFSHVTHDEGPEGIQMMLRKANKALKSSGYVVIHDFVTNDEHTSPVFGALFSVHLLTYTFNGRTYSRDEYENWIRLSGFSLESVIPICTGKSNESTLFIAKKG